MYEDKTPEAIKAEILAAIRQSQGLSAIGHLASPCAYLNRRGIQFQ